MKIGVFVESQTPGQCTATVLDCNGTENGTATRDNCDRCVGGTTGKTACVATAEAETEACSYEGTVDNNNAGFKGTGFVNVPNAVGSKIVFGINASTAGSKNISFRYANGSTTNRPGDLVVNGTKVASVSLAPTGAFTNYATEDVSIPLHAGANSVQLVSSTADGLANIDQIGYVSTGLSKNCVVTGEQSLELHSSNSVVYPNPSSSSFVLEGTGKLSYLLTDLVGQVLENQEVYPPVQIGHNLPAGTYRLLVQSPESVRSWLIVKK